jgi:hypothetical protein
MPRQEFKAPNIRCGGGKRSYADAGNAGMYTSAVNICQELEKTAKRGK